MKTGKGREKKKNPPFRWREVKSPEGKEMSQKGSQGQWKLAQVQNVEIAVQRWVERYEENKKYLI